MLRNTIQPFHSGHSKGFLPMASQKMTQIWHLSWDKTSLPGDSPISVLTTPEALKTNLDYNIKVVLILLIVFACENMPRSWAPRDLVLTWYTSMPRRTQQPVPEELVGSNQHMHKKDITILKGVFYLLPAAHGDYSLSWTMHRLGNITPALCPPKCSLLTSYELILIS